MTGFGIEAALLGVLEANAELRHVRDGALAMVTARAVVDEGSRGKDAPARNVRLVWFGPEAEAVVHRLVAGTKVYVEGKLKLERWGEASGLAVTASAVQPLGQIGQRRPKKPRKPRKAAAAATSPAARPLIEQDLNDELPF